jgi:hypothetical protein
MTSRLTPRGLLAQAYGIRGCSLTILSPLLQPARRGGAGWVYLSRPELCIVSLRCYGQSRKVSAIGTLVYADFTSSASLDLQFAAIRLRRYLSSPDIIIAENQKLYSHSHIINYFRYFFIHLLK